MARDRLIPALLWCAIAAPGLLAGELTPPPGPVSPTMKPLDRIEPRAEINALPAGADAVHLIDQPGAYYLTANINGASGTNGLRISADNVSIDLNGFAITGVAGSLHGVVSAGAKGLTLRDGTITGFGMRGVEAASTRSSVFDSLIVRGCGDKGIAAGFDSIVRGCIASGNSGDGIFTNTGALVAGCVSNANSGDGFDLSVGCTIIGCVADDNAGSGYFIIQHVNVNRCTARNNGLHGLQSGAGTTVRGSLFRNNDGHGIRVTTACELTGNHCDENVGPGIRVDGACLVADNFCKGNGFFPGDAAGILVEGATNTITGNTVIANDRGIEITAAGNVVTANTALGNTPNYDILAGNDAAPISSAATATSPLANIEN
jgi:parallel beta-helix repeat protein